MYKGIDDYVSKCIRLEPEEQEYFHSLLTHKKIKKKTLLLEAGQVCDFEAYIIKGCVRTYYVDENGFEVDLLFAIEDWWISDLASFSQQKPAQLYIETVEECELLLIDYASKEKLFKKVPAFERLFRLMVQRTHETMMNRLISNIAKSAEARYVEFVKKYPSIPQRVPQHLIAAYLGISPEFLSKIRTKNLKKQDPFS
ncbi:MAG TPA: Crp/Fnr family transcriptional regulator [Cytophagaceae bacterium]|jgi:CRP-like cAMP-binding protein|nr:Crp/Fnr family transcriptional regulator [Cytophagaceae bacterium]